jgi:malonyl-CoA O-methyltransferase
MNKQNDQHQSALDKRYYRESFNRAAQRYDDSAVLQKEIGKRLLERLDYIRLDPAFVVDLGSGTGLCTGGLAQRYSGAQIIAVDIAPAMLQQGRQKLSWWQYRFGKQRFVCADAEQLPFADASVDMVFSNLTLQWCGDLDSTFTEIRRVLKPNGLLMFTTMGPDTLKELRDSWRAVDDRLHVHPFLDMHDIGDALIRNRLADPVMDMEHVTLTYQHATDLMRDLKAIGAHNAAFDRTRGLTGKSKLSAMRQHYETYRTNGVLPATYEIVYGQAWMSTLSNAQQPRSPSGDINVTLQRPSNR